LYDLISLLLYFPPESTVCESRTIIAWPKGKNKDTGGKNIIYYPPVEIHRYCHKKRLCPAGKILFDFPFAIFSPQFTIRESRTIIA
jgi:hypothetical protein